MIEAGRLPNLARLAAEGSSGPLRSFRPLYSPRVWNSIATGKTPDKHGIEGFVRTDPKGEEQLYLSTDRRAHALWNITSDAGMTVGVVNWWNTYPPDVIRGVMISDHVRPERMAELREFTGAVTQETAGSRTWPPEWTERAIRVLAERRGLTRIKDPFLGNVGMARWMEKEELSRRYYEDAAAARIGLDIEEELHPDLLMVLLSGIDRVSHHIWAAVEPDELYPESMWLTPRQREAARDALHGYYAYTDAIIGLFLRRFAATDLVLVVSDHGFEAGEHMGALSGVHESEKAQDGILFIRGPGIPPGGDTTGTTVNDIAPSILAWLGLPLGRDMDGRPAPFLAADEPRFVETHDTAPVKRLEAGPSGHEQEILEQLRGLGYIE
jgi:arylsulfatase A-like enzyme